MTDEQKPTLTRSIVVCAYTTERWDLLMRAVEGAAGQLRPADELLIVIDHNEALLDRATRAFGAAALVVPNENERGLSGARNTGVATAGGDIVVFLDDDATPEPGWLDALTEPFSDENVVGTGGWAEPSWPEGAAPDWMPEEFLWVVGCSYRGLPTGRQAIRNPIGCNMAFRRSAVLEAGGFSTDLGRVGTKPVGGEETDLAIRATSAGGTILHTPDATVTHHVSLDRISHAYFRSRCFHEGRSKAILAARVGAESATSAERSYISTLAAGIARRLGRTLSRRSITPLRQAVAIVVGLGATGAGFAIGLVTRNRST